VIIHPRDCGSRLLEVTRHGDGGALSLPVLLIYPAHHELFVCVCAGSSQAASRRRPLGPLPGCCALAADVAARVGGWVAEATLEGFTPARAVVTSDALQCGRVELRLRKTQPGGDRSGGRTSGGTSGGGGPEDERSAPEEALSGISKAGLLELMSFTQPPPVVGAVGGAVCVLLGLKAKRVPGKDGRPKDDFWPTLREQSKGLLALLRGLDVAAVPPASARRAAKLLSGLTADGVAKGSLAAAALFRWAQAVLAKQPATSGGGGDLP